MFPIYRLLHAGVCIVGQAIFVLSPYLASLIFSTFFEIIGPFLLFMCRANCDMSDLIRISPHRSEGIYVGSYAGHPAAWTSVPDAHGDVCNYLLSLLYVLSRLLATDLVQRLAEYMGLRDRIFI